MPTGRNVSQAYELQNLAGWYRYLLQAYPKENVAFTNAMKEALTGFQTLRFSPNEYGRVRLWADFPVRSRLR